MGTNYYLVYNEKKADTCPCCGHETIKSKELHLGKSSAGWVFSLHIYPDMAIRNWNDIALECLHVIWKGGWIKDEYGTAVEWEMFVHNVTKRGSDKTLDEKDAFMNIPGWYSPMAYRSVDEMLKRNNAIAGTNNLLRHKVDERCVGHGEGTYDYCIGEFS